MNIFTISDIERAINYWRERYPAGNDGALCASARVLADVYGAMIYFHRDTVGSDELSTPQAEALGIALRDHPL
jgi:hypothetical protein